ncbi:hypothetical protein [Chelativorans salis]|uniref:Uncharacterized protein n=1 Tax=Chelativorans salis TaxID=2978478 RepID=A0ABT2LGK5_9HYPH|nr:hypothetical protein [Chelativorans sp. EGI FJ00035]MCT7373560.1 hypothetical protein [Chelativorans sp. EGI FJ00035]
MSQATLHARLRVCIALIVLIPATAVRSQSSEAPLEEIPVGDLKQIYLYCEDAAIEGDLDTSEIMKCSTVYEDLKRRAFGGDFKLLKAWADTQAVVEGY